MNRTVHSLAILYNKINKGIATEEEKMRYDMGIRISCIQEDVLVKAIKQAAKEIETE